MTNSTLEEIRNKYFPNVVEDMKLSEEERSYNKLIDEIRVGMTFLEEKARKLAENYGFSKDKLESALKEGCRNEYQRRIHFLRQGLLCDEPRLRELAKRCNFPINELDKALETGRREAYEGDIRLIKYDLSWQKECEPEARELIEKFGFPKEPLEEAIKIAKQQKLEERCDRLRKHRGDRV